MFALGTRRWSLALAALLVAAGAGAANANLLVNGSFESGPAPGAALALPVGSTAVTGWVVTRAGIDYVGTLWTAAEGARSIGLNGTSPGGLAQTFPTLTNAEYTVRCYMAGDPETLPNIKSMRVEAAGQSVDFHADITDMWAWDPGWNSHVWSFTAISPSTTLEFHSLDSGDAGPSIDSVTVALTSTVGVLPHRAGAFRLAAPAPNPARSGSYFQFTLPEATPVHLAVFDLAGREVSVIADAVFTAGDHGLAWDGRIDGRRAPAGVYLVALNTPGRQSVQRLALLK